MLKVGLTGGIASGKSVASTIFARLGVAIIDTDIISRELVEPGSPALQEIIDTFGEGMLRPDGKLDRRARREEIFTSDEKRRQLEEILHPKIRDRVSDRVH